MCHMVSVCFTKPLIRYGVYQSIMLKDVIMNMDEYFPMLYFQKKNKAIMTDTARRMKK